MYVTVLPASDPSYECAPKFKGPLTFEEVFHRVVMIITGKLLIVRSSYKIKMNPSRTIRKGDDNVSADGG